MTLPAFALVPRGAVLCIDICDVALCTVQGKVFEDPKSCASCSPFQTDPYLKDEEAEGQS